mmetsp:Transcript_7550/g.22260  ORF Transcript_7550/g.22260 Transcript_7550/m.22260 type:complete len:88 (+) Transcript_7550:226-489(+)
MLPLSCRSPGLLPRSVVSNCAFAFAFGRSPATAASSADRTSSVLLPAVLPQEDTARERANAQRCRRVDGRASNYCCTRSLEASSKSV